MHRIFHRLFIIVCICITFTACASKGDLVPYPQKHTLLLERGDEFFKHFVSKKFDRMFDMHTRETLGGLDKKQYTNDMNVLFDNTTMRALPTEILHRQDNQAQTKTIMLLTIEANKYAVCISLVWIWEKDTWYIQGDGPTCIPPVGTLRL